MKKRYFLTIIGIFLAVLSNAKNSSLEEVETLAGKAFLYCFATVEHNKTLTGLLSKSPTNTFCEGSTLNSPINSFAKFDNKDVHYNMAVLDIRNEPVIISIPEIKGRYYNVQMVDMYTNCIEHISVRANGEETGNFLIVRTDWKGNVPSNVTKVIKSSATVLLAFNRTQVFHEEDAEAKIIHSKYKVVPLSEFLGVASPIKESLKWDFPDFDPKSGSIEEYFNLFNQLIAYQILSPEEKKLLKEFSKVGIAVGKEFKKSDFTPEVWTAIETGATKAREKLRGTATDFSDTIYGWVYALDYSGRFGDNYHARAEMAWRYMYADMWEESLHYYSFIDSHRDTLSGEDKYVLMFSQKFIPQAKHFWSLTIYKADGQLCDNELNRHSLNSAHSPIKYNEDGSFVLYIQKDNPGEENVSNWLPAPDDKFVLVFRAYGGDLKFKPVPPVVRTNQKKTKDPNAINIALNE